MRTAALAADIRQAVHARIQSEPRWEISGVEPMGTLDRAGFTVRFDGELYVVTVERKPERDGG